MNTIDKILQYIDDYYRYARLRPPMYFSTPDCYEDVVFSFENLRDFILDSENPLTCPRHSYSDFLLANGFGSARFTTRYKESHPEGTYNDDDFFKAYSEFLMEYLKCNSKTHSKQI